MTLYKNIRNRRLFLNLSQRELADKLGYKSTSTIAKIESGENDIPQSKIKAFADALETTPGALMGWELNPNDVIAPEEVRMPYYFNTETARIAQAIHDDQNLRILFDASRKLEPEDIQFVVDLVKKLKKKEIGGDYE